MAKSVAMLSKKLDNELNARQGKVVNGKGSRKKARNNIHFNDLQHKRVMAFLQSRSISLERANKRSKRDDTQENKNCSL